jgi:hypothetical protein
VHPIGLHGHPHRAGGRVYHTRQQHEVLCLPPARTRKSAEPSQERSDHQEDDADEDSDRYSEEHKRDGSVDLHALLAVGLQEIIYRAFVPRFPRPCGDPLRREAAGDLRQAEPLETERVHPSYRDVRIIGTKPLWH